MMVALPIYVEEEKHRGKSSTYLARPLFRDSNQIGTYINTYNSFGMTDPREAICTCVTANVKHIWSSYVGMFLSNSNY